MDRGGYDDGYDPIPMMYGRYTNAYPDDTYQPDVTNATQTQQQPAPAAPAKKAAQ